MNNGWELFIKQLELVKNQKELEDFLLGILTPQERDQLPKRLEIIKRLKKNQSQWKIAEDLGVGLATVTRGSKELQKGRFKYVN